jgi:transcriptional regulator with XRE-family HTH domain
MGEMAPAPDRETIGLRLRRLRLEKGLSQRELSSPGVSYAYISRIEAGTRQPSVKALRKLAPKLGVSVDYLETGSEIGNEQRLELLLADAELALRLDDGGVEPEKIFRQIVADAVDTGESRAASRARLGVGLAVARQGRHEEAVLLLEEADSAGVVDPVTRPDVYTALGRAYSAQGRQQRAADLFDHCLAVVGEQTPEDSVARVRYATYLSYALTDMGSLERAQEVLTGAVEDGEDLGDTYTQIRLYWSLARLLSFQHREAEALRYARRAIALLEASEDTLQLARAYLLYASIFNFEGRAAEAREQLTKAEQLLGRRSDRDDLVALRTEQAKAYAGLGDADAAIAAAEEALGYDEIEPADRGGALAALGHGLALKGDLNRAKDAFRDAIDLLSGSGKWREAEQACSHWAAALSTAGREDEAEDARKRAAGFAARAVATPKVQTAP